MKKKFSKFLGVGLALVLACSFGLVPAAPVSAAITAGPTIAPVLAGTDDVAGKENAAYQITYTQDTTDTVQEITVTFPGDYTITDGMLGTAAVKNGDGSEFSVVTIGALNLAVNNVIGDDANGTIVITLDAPHTYVNPETVSFRIVSGITNPTAIDDYGPDGLTVEDDATGNTAVQAASAVTIIAGDATQVLVEDATDGTGDVVIAQDVDAGASIIVYAITRDANDNFVANVAADVWSLESITGDVVAGDLVPEGDSMSATFTGALVGTAEIKATSGGLDTVNSGTLTVILSEATQVVMTPETDTSTVAGEDITFTAELQDAGGNHIDFTGAGDVTFSGGTGSWGSNALADGLITSIYTTSTSVVTDEVLTVTENLGTPATTETDTSTITTLPGTATQVLVETLADGSGTVVATQSVASGASIIVYAITRDVNDNFVENVAATAWSLEGITGDVVAGDLVPEGDSMSATFTGALVGTAEIHVVSGALTSVDSGTITVTVGAATQVVMTPETDTSTVAGEDITFTAELQDAGGNHIDFTGAGDVTFSGGTGSWGSNALADGLITSIYTTSTTVVTDEVLTVTSDIDPPGYLETDTSTITTLPGTATQVRVETLADGSGTVVATQSVASGASIIVYAITRDVNDNFVENVAADVWSLESITGDVVAGDLVPEGDSMSATFTGALVGTAEIHVVSGALTSVDSGTITVTVGAATQVVMTPETDTSTVAGEDITFTAELQDAGGNHIDFTGAGDVTFSDGTGTWGANALEGDGTITSVYTTSTSVVTDEVLTVTENLGTPATTETDTSTITTLPGTATQVLVETLADGSGTVVAAQSVASGASITVYAITRDVYDNFVENVAATAWSLEGITGDVVAGDLIPAGDMKSADFTGALVGTAEIMATSEALTTVNSGTLTVIAGTATQVLVETLADGTGDVVATQEVISGASITVYAITRDANDNFVENVDADAWSLEGITGDVVAGDLVGSGASATFTGALVGTAEIRAVEGELTSVDSGTITVIPGAKAGLSFVDEPTETVAGVAITPAVTVEIVDAGGNRVTTATDEITIAIDTNPSEGGLGALSGTATVAAEAGLATFSTLSIDKTGVGYTLKATAVELIEVTSGEFDIIPAAVFAIVVTADPTSIAVGTGTSAITATVTDEYDNLVADDTEVSFETTLGLVSPVTDTTTDGEATTTLTAGSPSGTATVTATADSISGNTTVVFTSLAATDITVTAEPMRIPAGGISTLTITVALVDEHGNTVPTAGATVHLATTAGALDPVSGITVAGEFTSELTSSTSPANVTVTASVDGMFSGSIAVDFYPPLEPNEIGLLPGWNAISLPLIPDDSSIEGVLDAVIEDVEIVWAYDPISRPLDPWFSYSPVEGAPTDLIEMEDGMGYWVKMTEGAASAILTITGEVQPEPPLLPKTYPVLEGWNFIGFKSLNPMLYDDYLGNIANSYSVIWGYYDGHYYDVFPLENQPYLSPGSGYWIWMTADGIIVPPGE